jgi:pyruvate ferredoxin oxidoreductase delta subunit
MADIYKELKSAKELPTGGIWNEPGSSSHRKTGDWKVLKPQMNDKKCINCMFCWAYCPDTSVIVKDGEQKGFDLEHCKGCGICAEVCPVKCIDMVPGR